MHGSHFEIPKSAKAPLAVNFRTKNMAAILKP